MIDLQTAQFLLSSEGNDLLLEAKSLNGSFLNRLTRLRKNHPPKTASAVLELLDLRKRAAVKFSKADSMFFTKEALEQSSGERISKYRSQRFRKDSKVLDLGCGIGGDTIGLAERCFVTAVDRDPVRILMAERNLEVYHLADRVRFTCADIKDIPLEADAVFIDPSRRKSGKRTTKLSEMEPPIEFIHHITNKIPDCAIKLSPAADDRELESLGGEIEFISDSGECKEALIWLGSLAHVSRRATILPERATLAVNGVSEVPVVRPSRYLYEPDPCVIRAHLIEQLAVSMGAFKIDEMTAYLTSENFIMTPFVSAYEIVESMPFNLKKINSRLNEMEAGKVIVKKRGVPMEPQEIEKKLRTHGDRELFLIITRVSNKPWAFICSKI